MSNREERRELEEEERIKNILERTILYYLLIIVVMIENISYSNDMVIYIANTCVLVITFLFFLLLLSDWKNLNT